MGDVISRMTGQLVYPNNVPIVPYDNIVLEGYIQDIDICNMSFDRAMEALDLGKKIKNFDGKKFLQDAKAAIKKFMESAVSRLMEFLGMIVERLKRTGEALSNITHRKEIAVSSDLYNAYMEIKKFLVFFTENANEFVIGPLGHINIQKSHEYDFFNGSPEANIARDFAMRNDQIRDMVEKVSQADIIGDMKLEDYIVSRGDRNLTRDKKIVPSKEQAEISKMSMKWIKYRQSIEREGQSMTRSIDMIEAMAKDEEKLGQIKRFRERSAKIYNTAIKFCGGASQVCLKAQKYITWFIRIDKELASDAAPIEGKIVEGADRFKSSGQNSRPQYRAPARIAERASKAADSYGMECATLLKGYMMDLYELDAAFEADIPHGGKAEYYGRADADGNITPSSKNKFADAAKKKLDAIGQFAKKAWGKVLEFVSTIVEKLGYTIVSLKNKTGPKAHKKIEVPSIIGNTYIKIFNTVESMAEGVRSQVASMKFDYGNFSKSNRTDEEVKKDVKTLQDTLENDILSHGSKIKIDKNGKTHYDSANDTIIINPNERGGVPIIPAVQQKELDGLRRLWLANKADIEKVLKDPALKDGARMSFGIHKNIFSGEITSTQNLTPDNYADYKKQISGIFNNCMTLCTSAMSGIVRLQRYLSFILKYCDNTMQVTE